MARPLRIQYENAYYHVTCRGKAREDIVRDDADRQAFLDLLPRSSEIYQVDVQAFVLMSNHLHLIIKTPLANLHEFMRHFNISDTSYFNSPSTTDPIYMPGYSNIPYREKQNYALSTFLAIHNTDLKYPIKISKVVFF